MPAPEAQDSDTLPRSVWVLAILVFSTMLSSTLLIPVVRPFIAAVHGGDERLMHAFMSVNMLGAIIGAPLAAAWADRTGKRRRMLIVLACTDATLLLVCSLSIPGWALLTARTIQGAANVGGLSILLGMARATPKLQGRVMGLLGATIMAAVACGAPVGTLLLHQSPLLPLWAGSALQLMVVMATFVLPKTEAAPAREVSPWKLLKNAPLLRWPTLWTATERFTVGCLVVTFSLYGHRVLNLSNSEVGILFSWFLLPFAASTYPMSRIAERVDRTVLVATGTLLYGVAFMSLGMVPAGWLPAVMLTAGLASAAIYAPSLCFAATVVDRNARSTSMGLMNAGGSLGMMMGTAMAGILSHTLMAKGWAPKEAYQAVFQLAGAAELVVLALSARGLLALHRQQLSTNTATPAS